jgi:hypothetical protein
MIYRCLLEPEDSRTLTPKQVYPGIELESTRTPLPTEILRSNRQIYSEASSLMYSELIVVLTPGDIVCLRPNLDDISAPNRGVWRHNPLAGIGVLGPHNRRIYNTPEMDGKMEPHVFSRFKHISLELEFNCNPEDLAGCPQLSIDPDLKDCFRRLCQIPGLPPPNQHLPRSCRDHMQLPKGDVSRNLTGSFRRPCRRH